MIEALVAWSVQRRAWVLGITVALAVASGVAATHLELDALPDITSNQVVVLTRAPGLTPEEVERRITRPIETALGGMPGLEEHRSLSRYGISSITAIFDDHVDPYRARQLVQERLSTAVGSLPTGVDAPELGPLSGGLGEIFHVILRSSSKTPAELFELATYKLAPMLRTVPGVVEVNSWGGQRRTLEIDADPVLLAQRGITLDELKESLRRATGSAAGASVDRGGMKQSLLRAVALPASPAELGDVLVAREHDGRMVRVADLATVREGSLPRIGAATADGRGEVVYLMAQMLRGENALDVMRDLHAVMPLVRAALPPGVELELVYDRSTLVKSTVHTVARNLAEGGLLVAIVLYFMLGSVRAGLIVAVAIPLSLLGAMSGMLAFGVAGNLMSLGAIDFGLVVDGAVVIVEQVFHSLKSDGPDASGDLAGRISTAAQSVARPMFFSVLIILLVYVPVLTLSGVDGKMFRPMAMTVVFALGTSLLLALTVIPAATSLLIRVRDVPAKDPWLVRALHRIYDPFLVWVSGQRALVACSAALLLVLGVVLFVRAGSELAPQLDEGDLVVQTTRAPDISLAGGIDRAGRLESSLRAVPEVLQVVSRIGSPAVATDIMGIEQADVFVRLRPREAWRTNLTRDALIAELGARIDRDAPGSDPSFTQPIQMRFNELLGGAVTDVTVAVYGDDLGELRRLSLAVAAEIRAQPGAVDVKLLASPDVSLVEVQPKLLEASQRGFSNLEILDAVAAVRSGIDVGMSYDGPLRLPIRLRLTTPVSALDLGNLALPTSTGGLVALSSVADIRELAAASVVAHRNGERRLLIGFNVRGADLGAVVAGAEARVSRSVRPPRGYRLVWGGQYESLQAATKRLTLVVPAVVVLILLTLFVAFRKVKPALLIFANVPFACVGGMVALSVRGMPVSISAAIGFIALSGVAVLNGVVLVSRILVEEQANVAPAEAAMTAARSRSRPVMMTALVAALGFVPMMLARGIGAEVQRPLATVVVGGLVTSTFLTLVILPTLYPWVSRRRRASP